MTTEQKRERIETMIQQLTADTSVPAKDTLDALENIRDKAEEYAQCIRDDLGI